jgi:hypothetical protein
MSVLARLARRGHKGAQALDAFNPDQPRDERGRWGEGGPGSGAETASEHAASAKSHREVAEEHASKGEHMAAQSHIVAAKFHETAMRFSSDKSAESRSAAARSASVQANQESAKLGAEAVKKDDETVFMPMSNGGKGNLTVTTGKALGLTNREAPKDDPSIDLNSALKGTKGWREQRDPRLAKDLRTTQTEMPAFTGSVRTLAPHAFSGPTGPLVGNEKRPETQMRSDPLRQTQKLEAVKELSVKSLTEREQAFGRALAASRSDARVLQQMGMSREEGIKTGARIREKLGIEEGGNLRQAFKTNPKEVRRDAAAASAGRWASKATEVKTRSSVTGVAQTREATALRDLKSRLDRERNERQATRMTKGPQTQEDRIRIAANVRAKGDKVKAERFMEQEMTASSLSKANALSALAASHASRGNHAEASKYYDESAKHFVKAGNDQTAAKMRWSSIESQGKAKKP